MFLAYRFFRDSFRTFYLSDICSFELYLSGLAWWIVEFIKWIVCHLDQPLFHFVEIYTAVNQSDIRYEICFDIIKIVYATVKKNGVIFRVLLNQERAHVVIREILAEICYVQKIFGPCSIMDDGVKFHGSYVLKRCHNNVFFADRLIYPFIGMMKDIDFDAIDFSTDTSFRNEMSG